MFKVLHRLRSSFASVVRTEVPELRIVDEELWSQVKLRQGELSKQSEATIKGVRPSRASRTNGCVVPPSFYRAS
jgi:hypothetical protein